MSEKKAIRQQSFLHGAAVLAAATAIVKLLGAVYSIPLKVIIGEKGFGYYSTAYEIYSVLLMISTTGLPVAMSRMIAEARTLNCPAQIRKVFRVALRVFLTLGIVGFLGMLLLSKPLSRIQTNPGSWFAIAVLSPSVLLISLIAAFRGFFQGQSDMTPTSVSQVFEAVCKLVVGLTAAVLLMKLPGSGEYGSATYGAGGAILGVTASCIVSVIYLWQCYRKAVGTLSGEGEARSDRETMKQLLTIAIPITVGAAGLQFINLVDMAVMMRRLVYAVGLSQDTADTLKGTFNFCQKIFNLPCAFITPITISVIPAITAGLTKQDMSDVRMLERSAMRVLGLIAMPCTFGLFSLGGPISNLLGGYTGEALRQAGQMMSLLGLSVLFNAVVLVTNAIMQAHGDVTTPVRHMIIGGLIRVVCTFCIVAIPSVNILGAAIDTLICYVLITVMNVVWVVRKKLMEPAAFLGMGKSLLAGAIMGVCAYLLNRVLASFLPMKLACIAAIGAAAVIYGILVLAFRIIAYEDCMLLPGGGKIAKLLRIHPDSTK